MAGSRARYLNDTESKMPDGLTTGHLVLATSYSRTACRRTTIGAAAFHCRVRNGNGWCHCANVTRDPSRTGGFDASRRRGSLETMSIFQRTADSLISTYRFWESSAVNDRGYPPSPRLGRTSNFKALFCFEIFCLFCLPSRKARDG
jgi:hypothetical protein